MNIDLNRPLQAAEVNQMLEDTGAGEVAVASFWNLFVRVISDPLLAAHKAAFLQSVEMAVESHKGFGERAITTSEMLDGYEQLVDAMMRLRRSFPTLRVSISGPSFLSLIQQFEGCLHWSRRADC